MLSEGAKFDQHSRTSVSDVDEEQAMKTRKMLEELLLLFQTTIINIGLALGFNTFYYSRKHKSFINSKWLYIYCKFMAFVFFLAYPFALLFYFYEDDFIPIGVTDYARIGLSVANWLLCFAIYLNQASSSSSVCAIFNQASALYHRYVMDFGTERDVKFVNDLRLKFMTKCVLRSFILLFGFLVINLGKFGRRQQTHDSVFELILYSVLFLPSVIITFTSNRFYTAATCCLFFIEVGNENLRATEVTCQEFVDLHNISLLREKFLEFLDDKISMSLRNHTALHQLFIKYHDLNAKYIIFIIGYCILNVIFELFFLYLNMSVAIQSDINLSSEFIFSSCAQTTLYMYEFISIIFIYNKLKMESEECSSILQQISMACRSTMRCAKIACQIETYSIQLMHCIFDVTVCGLFTVNKSLLFSIISSITTYLIIIIQFRVEELSTHPVDPEENKYNSMFGHDENKTMDDMLMN